jgi:L-threonylcarbamoyladenylate synthase
VTENHPHATHDDVANAADILNQGGLVGFPTETVYGLAAVAFDEAAVRAVFGLKQRPANNPLIVHVDGPQMARLLVAHWPDRAQQLAERFWPGPLTLVLDKAEAVPDVVTGGGPTVALRCPDHPLALELIRTVGKPLVGPSANPSGQVSPTTAAHVRHTFPDLFVLDGGPCSAGIESTVLSLVSNPPRVLRPGVITPAALGLTPCPPGAMPTAASGRGGSIAPDAPLPAPGLLPAHYAPSTPLTLTTRETFARTIESLDGSTVAAMPLGDTLTPPVALCLRMPDDAAEYARALYATLLEADANPSIQRIIAERPAAPGALWDAVRDRLDRGAGGR